MKKYVFGITGPTGAGKTTVSDIFRNLGVHVVDADVVARNITRKDEKCLKEIRSVFGDAVFASDMVLDRKALAKIVFTDVSKLKLLNEITHKYIKKAIENEIADCKTDIIAIDGAVIIGSPVMDMCRVLVVVTADTSVRIERIMQRDELDYTSACQRINSQMSNAEYESFADFLIQNNDGNVGLGEYVEDIYNKIKNISTSRGA